MQGLAVASAALETLVESVNAHDTYTGGHSVRVARNAASVARTMGLAGAEVALVEQAGLVHDLGKVAIPESILAKAEPLTPQEYELVTLHPVLGASILARMEGMEAVIPIVLHHHERWDGGGYPRRIGGADIPLAARIIFAVDTFDAMTSARPYGKVFEAHESLAEIRRCGGMQFDPEVVDAVHETYGTHGLAHDAQGGAEGLLPSLAL